MNNSHADQLRHHRRVSSCRLYHTLGTRGFVFSCHETLQPMSSDCQPSNTATLSSIYWLILQQFAVSLSVFCFYRFHRLYVGSISATFPSPVYVSSLACEQAHLFGYTVLRTDEARKSVCKASSRLRLSIQTSEPACRLFLPKNRLDA